MNDTEPQPAIQGVIILEWPPAPAGQPLATLDGWSVSIFDAHTGKPITTVEQVTVNAALNGFVTADLVMWTDSAGRMLLDPRDLPARQDSSGRSFIAAPGLDGRIRTGTFRFLVGEMRVRRTAPHRGALIPKFIEPAHPQQLLPEPA